MKTNKTSWKTWSRGLNTLQSSVNIRDDELSEALNIILTDEGHPTRRPGTDEFGDTTNSTYVPPLIPHYSVAGVNNLMVVSNGYGLLRNDNTGAWATITSSASFPSSRRYNWAMINNVTYIASDSEPLTKFDGTYLTRFTTITTPTGLAITRGASLASGQFRYSYKITAENAVGETAASSAVTVQVNRNRNQWNFDPTSPTANYSVTLSWNAVSGATKYNIYGVDSGGETYLDSVTAGLSFVDYGTKTPSVLFAAPTGNSTGAPRGEIIKIFKSSVFIAGDPNAPSRLWYSAGIDKPDSFTLSDGGGWIDINSNADDGVITGLGVFQDKLMVFKTYSVWQFDFSSSLLPSLGNIRQGLGCISHKSILPVENDMFFVGLSSGSSPAIYTLGNEPNFQNVIRTNEVSARVRPYLTGLIPASYKDICAIYQDSKYHLFYTNGSGGKNNAALVYDREKLGFTRFDGISVHNPLIWRNTNEQARILYSDANDFRVSEYSTSYDTDKGEPIVWEFTTKFKQNRIPSRYERTRWVNMLLKDINGLVKFKFYHGNSVYEISQTIQAFDDETSFGYWQFGEGGQFGTTGTGVVESIESLTPKSFPIYRIGNAAVSQSFGFGMRGEEASSVVTLLNLDFGRSEMSESLRPLETVVQI